MYFRTVENDDFTSRDGQVFGGLSHGPQRVNHNVPVMVDAQFYDDAIVVGFRNRQDYLLAIAY